MRQTASPQNDHGPGRPWGAVSTVPGFPKQHEGKKKKAGQSERAWLSSFVRLPSVGLGFELRYPGLVFRDFTQNASHGLSDGTQTSPNGSRDRFVVYTLRMHRQPVRHQTRRTLAAPRGGGDDELRRRRIATRSRLWGSHDAKVGGSDLHGSSGLGGHFSVERQGRQGGHDAAATSDAARPARHASADRSPEAYHQHVGFRRCTRHKQRYNSNKQPDRGTRSGPRGKATRCMVCQATSFVIEPAAIQRRRRHLRRTT